jgi:hypothetical protein
MSSRLRHCICLMITGWATLMVCNPVYAQHPYERTWVMGYDGPAIPAVHFLKFDLENTTIISTLPSTVVQKLTNASICDSLGNLLFFTNGRAIANVDRQIITRGDTLVNAELYRWHENSGFYYVQGALMLPDPDTPERIHVISQSSDVRFDLQHLQLHFHPQLYYARIDKAGDDWYVSSKNNKLSERFYANGINAVRHANNRDWWILTKEAYSNHYISYLFDGDSIRYHHTDTIGIVVGFDTVGFWMGAFSYQGDRFALFNPRDGLEVFDFDRSTGRLSNFKAFKIPEYRHWYYGSVAFSPSGRYLYFNDPSQVYQMDLEAANWAASITLVDEWDGYVHNTYWATAFFQMQRTPDCRIIISTQGSNPYLHIIHEPDKSAQDCRLEQRALEFEYVLSSGLPNYPNFSLGTEWEHYCSSPMTGTSQEDRLQITLSVWPNPASDIVSMHWEERGAFQKVTLLDLGGIVLQSMDVSGNEQASFWLHDQTPGIYILQFEHRSGYLHHEKVVRR